MRSSHAIWKNWAAATVLALATAALAQGADEPEPQYESGAILIPAASANEPPSDGHMTGLAVLVLRDAGVAADDDRIQAAVGWLKTNQRVSGRWWTRSLNTDADHYITFSAAGYSLLALAKFAEF